jgi:uncharacterized membrane protein SpoIIM required for sporulation
MMTPLTFEKLYQDDWSELEELVAAVRRRTVEAPASGVRIAELYRKTCEHLALARARFYPAYLIDRLERITGETHQLIYQQREIGMGRLRRIVASEFPAAVRRDWRYVVVATATFLIPTVLLGLLVYSRPELILSVVDAETAASFEEMYSPAADSIGRLRTASTDWMMFGYYIRNNVGVAFQCFASGLFAGVGSLFFLAYNGAFGGAIAGFLTERGLSSTFYPFVATHSAFELTAIFIAGGAGLKIGHGWLAPGRLTRIQSLVDATRTSAVLLYGVTALLLVAAAIEAFWSSARWIPSSVKYAVAAVCWTTVLAYLVLQGRRAD